MTTIAVGLILIAGALGWTKWLAIPLGYFLYWANYRDNPARRAQTIHAAWLVAPLVALGFMWVADTLTGLILR